MSQKILKKVSIATVCAAHKGFKTLEAATDVMRIMGLARAFEVGTSTYGEFFKFKGEFTAIDLQTQETAIGAVAFLPAPVDALLASTIRELGEGGKPVEFGFDIRVIPDDTEVGYHYEVKTLIESKPSNPMAALMNQLAAVPLPVLAAPAAATDPAPNAPADSSPAAPSSAKGKGKAAAK